MMTMKVNLTRRQRQDQARLRYDVEQLNDAAILDEFRATLGEKSAPLHLLDNIQDILPQLKNATNNAARDFLGICNKQTQTALGNSRSIAGL